MGKDNRSLRSFAPHKSGEQNFFDLHVKNVEEPVKKDLPNDGEDGVTNASSKVKVFNRKDNHFGNDLDDSIKNYDPIVNPSELDEVIKNMISQFLPEESKFDKLKNKIKKKEGYSEKGAAAVAAIAGRAKYGKEGMAKKAAAGRRHAHESILEASTEEIIARHLKKSNDPVEKVLTNQITESNEYKVPKSQVHQVVDAFHVSKSDHEIVDEFKTRIAKNKSFKWPDALVARTIDYALRRHHNNQKLYSQVMSGNFKEEEIMESLASNANASDYIDDFVHSKDSRFEGKSKKERIRMALGAYYGHHKETIDEKFEQNLPWIKSLEKEHQKDVAHKQAETLVRKAEVVKKRILTNRKKEETK